MLPVLYAWLMAFFTACVSIVKHGQYLISMCFIQYKNIIVVLLPTEGWQFNINIVALSYHDTIIGITTTYLKFIDKINQMIARRKEKKANFLTISKPYPQPPFKIVVICFKYKNINLVVFSTFIKLLTQNWLQ